MAGLLKPRAATTLVVGFRCLFWRACFQVACLPPQNGRLPLSVAFLPFPHPANKKVSALRERHPELVIHVHTHDSAGTGVAAMVGGGRGSRAGGLAGVRLERGVGAMVGGWGEGG